MKKIIISIFVMLLLVGVVNAEFDYTKDFRDSKLTAWSKIQLWLKGIPTMTAAGEERQCSEYPDETKIVSSFPYTIDCGPCGSDPGLINIYRVNSDGSWDYFFERECPYTLGSTSYGTWALELYCCPPLPKVCDEGETKCRTETSIYKCSNNQWVLQECPSGQKCDLSGKCSSVCEPKWMTGSWGECINGKQTRVCYDARNCGIGNCPYETGQSCTVPPPTDKVCCEIPYGIIPGKFIYEWKDSTNDCGLMLGIVVDDEKCKEVPPPPPPEKPCEKYDWYITCPDDRCIWNQYRAKCQKGIPLTKEEFRDIVREEDFGDLWGSVCYDDIQCAESEEEVKCTRDADVKKTLDKGQSFVQKYLFKSIIPTKYCKIITEPEPGLDLCSLAFFEITGDCQTDGTIILIGGIILFIIIIILLK